MKRNNETKLKRRKNMNVFVGSVVPSPYKGRIKSEKQRYVRAHKNGNMNSRMFDIGFNSSVLFVLELHR